MHLSFYELINRSTVFAETIVTASSALSWLFIGGIRLSAEKWPETKLEELFSHKSSSGCSKGYTNEPWLIIPHSITLDLEHHHHCRAEGWKGNLITLPTVRKNNARDEELITL